MGQMFKNAPELEYAKAGVNPTMKSIEHVRAVLQAAEKPMSRNQILDILHEWKHSTTRQTLNAILEFFGDHGMVAEGSKGLIWVPKASPQLLEIIRSR